MQTKLSKFFTILIGVTLLGIATACSGVASGGATSKQWKTPPDFTIDINKFYRATLKTARGDIKIDLFADKTPITVNNFVFLARQGFYDNTTFHRVLKDFMAQGGDPTGTGSGGPGYTFGDELVESLKFTEAGLLAMANSGANTNGSQFFITYAATPWLNGKHTIFGKVVEGMDVAKSLTLRDPSQNPGFPGDTIYTVSIEESAIAFKVTPSATIAPTPTQTVPPVAKLPTPADGRPLAKLTYRARLDLFNTPPAMTIDLEKSYKAEVQTTKGKIVMELYPESAPQSVNNFVILANLGYWDGFPINSVSPGLFLLTGSPLGDPASDVGYSLPSELGKPNVAGSVGYWINSKRPGSSGSMVFILLQDRSDLDNTYTIFGKVIEGLDICATLTTQDLIETITIIEG